MSTALRTALLTLCVTLPAQSSAQSHPTPTGIFEDHTDIGTLLHPGAAHYDESTSTYTLTGSGANMWAAEDDFQFAWKKISGDVYLSADIALTSATGNPGAPGNPHRKAVLMIRQSLDPASPAVDIALHGNGLAALQFRLTPGGTDHEVEFGQPAPQRVRLEKRGDFFYAFAAGPGLNPAAKLQPTGASIKLPLTGDYYIGIGVCAHDKDATTSAIFRNVKLAPLATGTAKPVLWSALETVPIASTDRHVVYTAPAHFEAPNWSPDSTFLFFNQDGGIYRLLINSDVPLQPTRIPTGPQTHCNNDHGLSPDGQTLGISDSTAQGKSLVYTVPVTGGTPKQITTVSPSYWHSFSPDGQTIAFTSTRDNNSDVYTIPAAGGPEHRLTTDPGIDNGPDYSPDGQWIYFNSERTGPMQIWRMHPDGSSPEQVLTTSTTDWFPHISPNGKWMVFLSYEKGVKGHPADKDVTVNLMSLADKSTKVLATLFGGQGTLNVPSWSPDSTKIAFVSYQYLPDEPRE
jgi:TolB protein